MKRILVLIFSLLTIAAAATAYFGPIKKYVVECSQENNLVFCKIEHEDNFGTMVWRLNFSREVVATMRTQAGGTKSTPVVNLYLNTVEKQIFAASFQGAGMHEDAADAVAKLNQVFSKTIPNARIEVETPPYFSWFTWAGIALLVGFIIVIYRELNPKRVVAAEDSAKISIDEEVVSR